jgi:hypothetical protein
VTRTGIDAPTANDAVAVLKQAWRTDFGGEPPSAPIGFDGPSKRRTRRRCEATSLRLRALEGWQSG